MRWNWSPQVPIYAFVRSKICTVGGPASGLAVSFNRVGIYSHILLDRTSIADVFDIRQPIRGCTDLHCHDICACDHILHQHCGAQECRDNLHWENQVIQVKLTGMKTQRIDRCFSYNICLFCRWQSVCAIAMLMDSCQEGVIISLSLSLSVYLCLQGFMTSAAVKSWLLYTRILQYVE